MFKTKNIVYCALLIAMQVILSRFCSINTWNLKIGLGFLPVAVAGLVFGPLYGGMVGALSDFIGATLFPIGAYFPGFTVTLALTGIIFGLIRKNVSTINVIVISTIDQVVLSLIINSLWISILYGSKYSGILITRLTQCVVMIPIEIILTLGLVKFIPYFQKRIK